MPVASKRLEPFIPSYIYIMAYYLTSIYLVG